MGLFYLIFLKNNRVNFIDIFVNFIKVSIKSKTKTPRLEFKGTAERGVS